MTTTTTVTEIETETCSRCGGCGEYSYNPLSGSRCFKCNGTRKTYTKRGLAAREFLTALRSKRAGDVQIGDLVDLRDNGKFLKVAETAPAETMYNGKAGVILSAINVGIDKRTVSQTLEADRTVLIGQSAEQKAVTLASAIAYQSTLTKSGTVRGAK